MRVISALLVLGLAMAAATVTFSVVDTIVLRQLPFEHSEDLTALVASPNSATFWQSVSGNEVMTWPGRIAALDSWAAVASGSEALQISGERTRVVSARVTPSLFDVLRSKPEIGRLFTAVDQQTGNGSVAVISFELWQRMFSGDPRAIGAVLPLAAGPATVIGVLSRNGGYPLATTAGARTELWTPLDVPAEGSYLRVIARRRPDVQLTVASAQLLAATHALIQADPVKYQHWSPTFVPLYDVLVGPVRLWMLLILWGVGLLLLVACVNMANLLLIRAADRASEIAIRAALGATRQRLTMMLLGESVLLSLVPIAAALVVAPWGIEVARAALPGGLARVGLISLDTRVLVVALGSGVISSVVFGLLPAFHASRLDLGVLLRSRVDRAVIGRRWRSAFLVAEVTLVSMLLVATILFIGSFAAATRADLGFDRRGLIEVTTSTLTLPAEEAMRRLQAAPGVASVARIDGTEPLLDDRLGKGADAGGVTVARLDVPNGITVDLRRVSGGFFATARISVVRGTAFRDDEVSRSSLVVDDAAARQLFGTQDPIGKHVGLSGTAMPLTIVGVARQLKREGPEGELRRPSAYRPIDAEVPVGVPHFLIRLSRPDLEVGTTLQAAITTFTNSRNPASVLPLETTFQRFTAQRRFTASLMAIFGALALFVGAAGVYAVMSALLSQQMHEFGVRAALGATPGQLRRGIFSKALKHVAIGLALALPLAWWAARSVGVLFFGVQPTDLWVYLLVAGILFLAGLLASVPVARRAARADPIVSLRAS
jgi:predicted permease